MRQGHERGDARHPPGEPETLPKLEPALLAQVANAEKDAAGTSARDGLQTPKNAAFISRRW
jgi:hypothetical protein